MRKDKNLEELAEILIGFYKKGYTYNDKQYEVGKILAYYAKRIAELEHEIDEYEEKIKRVKNKYIRKTPNDTLEEQERYTAFNTGIDSVFADLDVSAYIRFKDKDRNKYY